MKPFIFNESPTLGVEEEFHLIDLDTADLCPRTEDMMEQLDPGMKERVCYELFLSVLENRTGVYTSVDELVKGVCLGRSKIAAACSSLGIGFAAAGSHPFASWQDQTFVNSDHYRWVRDNCCYVANRLLSFGLHIHVGVKKPGGSALYIMHQMRRWAYPLLALSANSPYYENMETGLASTRTHLFNAMPRSRFAPEFKTFQELVDYYEKLLQAGDVTRPGDLWWCIRPQPPLGTVEYRIFDLPTSVKRIGALAALTQAATAMYQDAFFSKEPLSVFHLGHLEQNWWRAQKDGLKAMIIEPETGEVISIKEQLYRLLKLLEPKARELDTLPHIDHVRAMIEQGSETEIQLDLLPRAGCKLQRPRV